MCGISGFNWKDDKLIESMVDCLAHRGPDFKNVYTDGNVSLGHNRLSIIDLSQSANQPMINNRGDLVIVFNGEIYNFLEIRKELEDEYDFKTKGDTEVILVGYEKWGKDIVEKLNGMFAFAIWDKNKKELFLARDRFGIKPLYYYWDEDKFIFASEVKAILRHKIERKLNTEALNHYMRVLYVPEPMTMIEGIYKLPPNHTLTLFNKKIEIIKYDDFKPHIRDIGYKEATKLVREEVISSVKRHLVSDVPVGVYLSGGIDSSTTLYAMSQFHDDIKTFSIGFDLTEDEESEKFNQDFDLAARTAKFFKTTHFPIRISVDDIVKNFEDITAQNDDPVSHPTSVAMALLAKHAKKEVTVVLTGSGGDEIFGGYDRYRIALAAEYYHKLPKALRNIISSSNRLGKLDYRESIEIFARLMFEKDKKISSILSKNVYRDGGFTKDYFKNRYWDDRGDLVEQFMMTDQKSWLPDYFFQLSDKMSMASGLEERVPMLDKELVSLADSLPRKYKLDLFRTKKILKDAFRNDLPEYLFKQPKRGWFSPGAKWLRDPKFAGFAREVFSENYYSETKSLFNWESIQRMLDKHIKKEEYNLTLLWAILTFQVWAKKLEIKI